MVAFTAAGAASTEPLVKVGDFHLKTARYGAAAVAGGDYVYVIGGDNGGGFLGDIERFDVRTHEIVRLTDRLTARRYHGAALAGGKIYVFGGQRVNPLPNSEMMEATVDVYDLATGLIAKGTPMPTPRSYAATVLFKDKVYVIGGAYLHGNAFVQTGLMEIYDLATGAWSTGPAMPTARECRAAVVDDFILVPGGYRSRARVSQVEFFVVPENAWKRLPDLCERVSANSVAFLGSELLLFGNFSSEKDVVAYDLRTRTSRVIQPGYLPARHTAAVVHAGRIYVVGGNLIQGSVKPLDYIQVFAQATGP
jgi:N-acetylneuraminic acid mutarotase